MLRWALIGTLSLTVNAAGWGLLGRQLGKPAKSQRRPPVELTMARQPTPEPPRVRPVEPPPEPRRAEPKPEICTPKPRPRPRLVRRRPLPRPEPRPVVRPMPPEPRPVAVAALPKTLTGTHIASTAPSEGITGPAPRPAPRVAPRIAPPPHPSIDLAGLKSRLYAAIARHRHYPRQARRRGVEGTVVLAFRISRAGAVTQVQVVRSAGALLDDAARAALRKAAPLPYYPDQVRVSVKFALDD